MMCEMLPAPILLCNFLDCALFAFVFSFEALACWGKDGTSYTLDNLRRISEVSTIHCVPSEFVSLWVRLVA